MTISEPDKVEPNHTSSSSHGNSDKMMDHTWTLTPEQSSCRPSISRHESCEPRLETHKTEWNQHEKDDLSSDSDPEWLVQIDSITSSEGGFFDERSIVPKDMMDCHTTYHDESIPATSREFAELFPSSRRLEIRHDETTDDGNMNLRVDTTVAFSKLRKRKFTLFHLRMHDLRNREFSLRRYCRDSGHEVCNSSRKQVDATRMRASHNSFSSGLSSLKHASPTQLTKQDSGYHSITETAQKDPHSRSYTHKKASLPPPHVLSLEFSNYAHLDLRRKGFPNGKHYDFEYWGVSYSWKRVVKHVFKAVEISYHLFRRSDGQLVAHIVPERLTDDEAREETEAGGWVPPCSMWINDQDIIQGHSDVADVLIATGIIALVDDSVRRYFRAEQKKRLLIPLPMATPLHINLDQFDPRTLIQEALGRNRRRASNE